MNKLLQTTKRLTTVLGITAGVGIILSYFILEELRPKMLAFEPITAAEEFSLNYFGVVLLVICVFTVMFSFNLVVYLRKTGKISGVDLMWLGTATITFLLIFGDFALINDIGKQYQNGLSQPEWTVLYIVMALQLIGTLILAYVNSALIKFDENVERVVRDHSVFVLAQCVGIVCGLVGLVLVTLNVFFPRPLWMIRAQLVASSIFILIPYGVIISYWFVIKFLERPRQWHDEKQQQDVGRAALITLFTGLGSMLVVYVANFGCSENVLAVLWLPLYLFISLLVFSVSLLFMSTRDEVG